MQVTNRKELDGHYTHYTLTATIEGTQYVARHIIPDHAYAALKVEDATALVEAQLWQQLMHTLEHHLRKAAYANTKNTHL